jgi:hypothetical protein
MGRRRGSGVEEGEQGWGGGERGGGEEEEGIRGGGGDRGSRNNRNDTKLQIMICRPFRHRNQNLFN